MKAPFYDLIDHTADFGIHVVGSDIKELFENAALALMDLITDTERLRGLDQARMEIAGDDWPDLMVNWLREILYLWNGEERLVQSVGIESISAHKITSSVRFDPYFPKRHLLKSEIKAVTYHQIQVFNSGDRWEARIIFDV